MELTVELIARYLTEMYLSFILYTGLTSTAQSDVTMENGYAHPRIVKSHAAHYSAGALLNGRTREKDSMRLSHGLARFVTAVAVLVAVKQVRSKRNARATRVLGSTERLHTRVRRTDDEQ